VEISEHIDELAEHGEELAAAAGKAGLTAAVPTCPGWTVRNLLEHIGQVHRWAASYVREGPAAAPPFGGTGTPPPPAEPPADGLLDWYRAGHGELLAALRAAPAGLQCWTFLPAPSPLAFWARRQAHETAIHRADAEAATGAVPSFRAPFAADGLDELLGGFFARRGGKLVADPPRSLRIAPTDTGRPWHITIGPAGREVSRDAGRPAGCTLRGRAADLYPLLWNRPPAHQPHVDGDPAVLQLWRDRAHIAWR
jgi:uncharacterized protein (TIGR03083 family)